MTSTVVLRFLFLYPLNILFLVSSSLFRDNGADDVIDIRIPETALYGGTRALNNSNPYMFQCGQESRGGLVF